MSDAHALLIACLRFDADASKARELAAGISAVGWDTFLGYADEQRLGSVLVRAIARLGLAPPVPALRLPDGRMTITQALLQREADHVARRGVVRERLQELTDALRAEGMAPVVLKGGRSIVTGQPDWRYLRDLDLLVPPRRAARAQQIVAALGYQPFEVQRPRLVHHHLAELYRSDMPGWIEVHRLAGTSRVEQFLPTAELLRAAIAPADGAVPGAKVLPAHLHILHGIVHHHIGHRAVKRSMIHAKGLYEFAAEVMELSPAERTVLVERAARHPRLLAILDLWVAAAADLFGMPVPAPLEIVEDAKLWWADMRDQGERMVGVGPELRLATDLNRMRRSRGGDALLRRVYWRVTTPLSFVKQPAILPALLRPTPSP